MSGISLEAFPEAARVLLAEDGIPWDDAYDRQLAQFCALVRHWNAYASLVSMGDLKQIEAIHLPDALSLTRPILEAVQAGASWLDIGTGGGFPALPVRLVTGELPLTLVERSEKKAGVIRQMLTSLHLSGVTLIVGAFPEQVPHPEVKVIVTARAVEKQEHLHKALAAWMRSGDCFLCQAAEVGGAFTSELFHVEQLCDEWSNKRLRRGTLTRISCL